MDVPAARPPCRAASLPTLKSRIPCSLPDPARRRWPFPRPPLAQQSAPVSDLRYDLAFTSATAQARSLTVTTRFEAGGTAPVLLSLPSWTPGAYEVSNFARRVSSFAVTQGGAPLAWDKAGPRHLAHPPDRHAAR